jgi:retron-type reverse transcriptase
MDLHTTDPFHAARGVGLLQQQAGVDPEVAELVQAYTRLLVDARRPLTFDPPPFAAGSIEERLFARLHRLNPSADERFLRFLAAYGGLLRARELPVMFNIAGLCQSLEMNERELKWMLAHPERGYRTFTIDKRGGGVRQIAAPTDRLRELQRWIARRLLGRIQPHPAAHAYTRGRSIVTNAQAHVGKRVVLRLDLLDFFPSIDAKRVRRIFQSLGYPYSVARALSELCTLNGRLPQGAPTSPALSNLACVTLDRRFAALGERLSFDYSRYADDLVFSSDNDGLPKLIPFFREVIEDERYTLNERKIRVMRQSRRQSVTGVVTNARVSLRRDQVRRLRAAMHRLRTRGARALDARRPETRTLDALRGHIAFLHMVDPGRAKNL